MKIQKITSQKNISVEMLIKSKQDRILEVLSQVNHRVEGYHNQSFRSDFDDFVDFNDFNDIHADL